MAQREKAVTRFNSDYNDTYDVHIERQQRKRQRLIRRLVLFSVIVAIAIGGMGVFHINQQMVQAEKLETYEQLEEELATLQEKETALKEEIELLNDEEYVLDIARTNYFFSKEGELIFNLPDEEPSY